MSIEEKTEEASRLRARRDFTGSERVLKAALEQYPASPRLLTDLAATVSQLGRQGEMEQHLRAALAADPTFVQAADPLARFLLSTGRPAEALEVTTPLADSTEAAAGGVLHARVAALRGLGRAEEALPVLEGLAERTPGDENLQFELTATLVDAGRFAEAETRLNAQRATGVEHGAAQMIRGFMMRQQDRWEEAEAAYREAVRQAPGQLDALRELSDVIWMRSGDAAAAVAPLDQAIAAEPARGVLRQMKARILQYAGDDRGAYAALEPVVGRQGSNPALDASASQAAVTFDPETALRLAQRAMGAAPDNVSLISICAEASLAAGKPNQTLELARRMRRLAPNNQHGVALMATAWRVLGDEAQYRALYDYERFVRPTRLDTPDGWDSLDAYLTDLAVTLGGLHTGAAHPIGQSVRDGSQTSRRLDESEDPVIKAFFQAADGPIRRYMAELGTGKDPLGARHTGAYSISGSWSVKLKPGGGRHVSHLHPWGWLSSACYIALPDAVQGEGREGWLNFGQPGIPTVPPLPAEHWIKPEPGMLVLFPSYMWHGTEPFSGDQNRLTAAFDVLPA